MNSSQFSSDIGQDLYEVLVRLFPICRSITGSGVRQTLDILCEQLVMKVYEVPTGTKVFDWTVPKEWNIRDAFIEDEDGNRIVDFKKNNLHIVSYSVPVDRWISLADLQDHLYSLTDQPDAIPYVTSYYKERWGFCIAHSQRTKLKSRKYHVFIDSELKEGHLVYAECVIPGKQKNEVFLSTYICHPSMANNELSGPVVTTFIGKWLASQPRKYTYRIVFVPETIGSITYISRHIKQLKENVIAGFNISCVGDERTYSCVSSRYGNTLADRVALNALSFICPDFAKYSFLERGSDERQYCSPGVDLPLVTLCRSKYGQYPEYHTSMDNLDLVTTDGLRGGYELVKQCINIIEGNATFQITCHCEPQLSKRKLYPDLSTKKSNVLVRTMMDFIAYADGKNDLIEISNIIRKPFSEIVPIAESLLKLGLLEEV